MMAMRITDNCECDESEFRSAYPHLLEQLKNKTVEELYKEKLIVFPALLKDNFSLNDKDVLFKCRNGKVKIGNLIGFLEYDDEKLEIHSRFTDAKQSPDCLFLYLMQQAMSLNLTVFNIDSKSLPSTMTLIQMLFPYYLDRAIKKGLFKQYRTFRHNDLNVRGPINFSRFLKEDLPFTGKIAYSNRNLTTDNPLIELIRHVIEYLLNSDSGKKIILHAGKRSQQNINYIIKNTPSYSFKKRTQIIKYNVQHPLHQMYFREYRKLQLLSLLILEGKGIELNEGPASVMGFLFDSSWLWENYLANILQEDLRHLDNRKGDFISVYQELDDLSDDQICCPDFINEKQGLILDAKYKKYDQRKINYEDLKQIILYSYIFKSAQAGVIYPSLYETKKDAVGMMKGYNAQIFKIGLRIPQRYQNYAEFVSQIRQEEQKLKALFK